MVVEIPRSRRVLFFAVSTFSMVLITMALAVSASHFAISLLFGSGMLATSVHRLKWESKKGALQMFSVFSSLLFMVLMVCLSTVGLPLDVASVILTILTPQIMVAMINYFDRGCNIQFGKFFESMNQKMVLQLMLTAAALFLTGLFAPQFLVWPDLSFEFLCVPLALILILPDLFYQNSRFNQKHTYTLSIVYGAMALLLMPHLSMSAYTVMLCASAVTGLFWNSKDNIEVRSRSWQSIAVTSLFMSTGRLGPLVASCAFGISSAKLVDLVANEQSEKLHNKVL